MSEGKNNPGSFEPGSAQVNVRPKSLSSQSQKADTIADENARRNKRRKSSTVPFKQEVAGELNPFILVDEETKGQTTDKPQMVRRRILIEPNFSLQERTTGHAENQFRQLILDQGITEESLMREIERGASNTYELGTLQPLRNVHDYVDYSTEALVENYVKEHAAGNLLLSTTFRYFILSVILLNAIIIGLETNPTLQLRYGYILEAIENVIMGIFILEILLKWYYNFDVFWKGGWNILDFVIVCILFFGSSFKWLGRSSVLRILRVVRAFRSLRDTPMFSGLSLIFDTIMRSMLDMGNICLLMIIIICLLGVVGVQIFGDYFPDTFGTFSAAVYSVFISQTQRGWIDIFNQFKIAGGVKYYGGFIYFVLTITLTSFVLKNMFVAVIVSNLRIEMKLGKEEHARKEALRNNTKSIMNGIKEEKGEEKGEEEEEDTRKHLEPMTEAARGWQVGEVQRRVLSPMFLQQIPVEELQKYLFLQVALEENLAEYQKIRARFKDIVGAVKDINSSYFHELRKSAPPSMSWRKSKVPHK